MHEGLELLLIAVWNHAEVLIISGSDCTRIACAWIGVRIWMSLARFRAVSVRLGTCLVAVGLVHHVHRVGAVLRGKLCAQLRKLQRGHRICVALTLVQNSPTLGLRFRALVGSIEMHEGLELLLIAVWDHRLVRLGICRGWWVIASVSRIAAVLDVLLLVIASRTVIANRPAALCGNTSAQRSWGNRSRCDRDIGEREDRSCRLARAAREREHWLAGGRWHHSCRRGWCERERRRRCFREAGSWDGTRDHDGFRRQILHRVEYCGGTGLRQQPAARCNSLATGRHARPLVAVGPHQGGTIVMDLSGELSAEHLSVEHVAVEAGCALVDLVLTVEADNAHGAIGSRGELVAEGLVFTVLGDARLPDAVTTPPGGLLVLVGGSHRRGEAQSVHWHGTVSAGTLYVDR